MNGKWGLCAKNIFLFRLTTHKTKFYDTKRDECDKNTVIKRKRIILKVDGKKRQKENLVELFELDEINRAPCPNLCPDCPSKLFSPFPILPSLSRMLPDLRSNRKKKRKDIIND